MQPIAMHPSAAPHDPSPALPPAPTPLARGPARAPQPRPAPGADAALRALLDQAQALAPEYGGGLTLHLPMALQALHALGASVAQLQALFERHAAQLPRRGAAVAPRLDAGWRLQRGRFEAFEPLRAHFMAALAQQGRDATLRAALPALVDGVSGGAFHGVIRVAHAVQAGHDPELASGLAYWAVRHAPLAAPAPGHERLPLALPDWVGALQALPRGGLPERAPLIAERIQRHHQRPGAAALCDALDRSAGPRATLQALACAAARHYAGSANLTVLHVVTSAHALLALLPWLDDADGAVRHFARAVGAGLLASAHDPAPPRLRDAPEARDWEALRQATLHAHEEHQIKLVAACMQRAAEWGPEGEQDLLAASRRVVALHAPRAAAREAA